MSLVGPRPITAREIELYYSTDEAQQVLSVPPGITGYWQVSGRSDVDYRQRINMNLYYVLNRSIWLDIIILLKTLKVMIKGKGAY